MAKWSALSAAMSIGDAHVEFENLNGLALFTRGVYCDPAIFQGDTCPVCPFGTQGPPKPHTRHAPTSEQASHAPVGFLRPFVPSTPGVAFGYGVVRRRGGMCKISGNFWGAGGPGTVFEFTWAWWPTH